MLSSENHKLMMSFITLAQDIDGNVQNIKGIISH